MHFEGLQLGRYRLVRLIGRGGAGNVYLAEDQRLTRQVAIKIIESEDPNSEATREATRLFEREARTIAMLSHPNILPLFDFGEETIDGTTFAYLVLPFCPEGSLVRWLRQHNSTGTPILLPQQVMHIVQQAADALEYAHDKQIIHRDVKPSNLLIRSRKSTPDRPDLLLADFGIARFSQATINASKTIRGTPKYMAPEQWRGAPVPATDQYALAVVAYELLTSRAPFQGTQEQVMYHHFLTQPQPPSAVNLRVTPPIDAVILQALAKQPEARFPSISEFARAFQQAVAEPPITPVISVLPPSPYMTILSPPLPVSTFPPVRDTPHISISTPGIMQSNDLHATLNISTTEAIAGANRTLTLPGGQHVKVAVPAGAYDGQVIRLESQVGASSPHMQKGDLIVTISVTPTSESPVIEAIPGAAPLRIKWRTVMLIGFVLIILLAGLVSFGINQFASKPTGATTGNNNNAFNVLQATSTAATASAAATATTTAQIEATAAVTNNPYDYGSWTLALNEPLSKNSTSRWDETSGRCAFMPDGYHVISPAQTATAQVCVAHSTDFGDVTFGVQMKIVRGSAGGMLFRSTGSASYYFRISKDGNYALLACAGAGTSCSTTLTGAFSSEITKGLNQSNVIAVVAKGNSIELYVNSRPIIYGVNGSISLPGQIGVVAEVGSEVVFSNAQVWKM